MATIRIELIEMGGGMYASNVIRKIIDSTNHDTGGTYLVDGGEAKAGSLYGRFTVIGSTPVYVNARQADREGPEAIRLVPEFPEVIAITPGDTLHFIDGDA